MGFVRVVDFVREVLRVLEEVVCEVVEVKEVLELRDFEVVEDLKGRGGTKALENLKVSQFWKC